MLKVREVITESKWMEGQGWSYKNSIYSNKIIEIDKENVDELKKSKPDWSWLDEIASSRTDNEDEDYLWTLTYYPADVENDKLCDDNTIASFSRWEID